MTSPYTELMLITALKRHREFDRSTPCSPANPGGHVKSAADLASLRTSITASGVGEPLLIHYDPLTGWALIGEGNHRIWLAEQAGQLTVPALCVYARPGYLRGRAGPQHAVPGEPRLRPQEPHGYFPAAFRPSLVFPASYFPAPPEPFVPLVDYEPCLAGR